MKERHIIKVIIDLIEDIRESIGNQEDFILTAMLLKEDNSNPDRLISAGEAPINTFFVDEMQRKLIFKIDRSVAVLPIGMLVKHLLVLPMADMMYELRVDIATYHDAASVVGFGKSFQEKKYFLFIKLV